MSDITTVFRDVLPPAAALICTGVLFALRWRDKQCDAERARYELQMKCDADEYKQQIGKLQSQLESAQLDARNQRDARISEAQAIVGEYRLHVEASTTAIERLEERLSTLRGPG